MSKKDKKQFNLSDLYDNLFRYKVLIFIVFVAVVYGYVMYREYSLINTLPNQSGLNSTSTTGNPNIDPATVDKIDQLQNNSVSVQALFNQARQNPFQE